MTLVFFDHALKFQSWHQPVQLELYQTWQHQAAEREKSGNVAGV